MNATRLQSICRVLLAGWLGVWMVAPAVGVTIEGQDASGNLQTASVDALGRLNIVGSGANATPNCTKPAFSNMTVSSTVISVLLPSNTSRSQSLITNFGPDTVWVSTVNAATIGTPTPGSAWSRVPKNAIFSPDSPASEVGIVYVINGGPDATSEVDLYTCGN